MEEMTMTVKRNADNARHTNRLATEARDRAERGDAVAARAVTAMTEETSAVAASMSEQARKQKAAGSDTEWQEF